MKTSVTLKLCFLLCVVIGGQEARVMQDRFWVESRSPIVSQRGSRHRDFWAQPTIDRKIHSLPTTSQKMTADYDETTVDLRPTSSDRHSSFSTLKNSFRRGKGLIRPREIFPDPVEDNSEEMQQCDSSRVRICEHCLKITRRPQAYENCCFDRNNAFGWCERIYSFTNRRNHR